MDKPDYILNFDKPKNTEIKYINGNWYLYERHNIYDPKINYSGYVKIAIRIASFIIISTKLVKLIIVQKLHIVLIIMRNLLMIKMNVLMNAITMIFINMNFEVDVI